MYENADFKKGLRIMVEGDPFQILDFQHVKPGKGNQFTRTKMRNLLTGKLLERTFKSGETFEVPNIETREMSFLYKEEANFIFMDKENYEQIQMNPNEVGDAANYIIENMMVVVMFYNERPVSVEVPRTVHLKVAFTEPGIKGDRVSGATKPARLETGHQVNVPLHITEGDLLKVDTESGEYLSRVNE
jgi:elongation factor P